MQFSIQTQQTLKQQKRILQPRSDHTINILIMFSPSLYCKQCLFCLEKRALEKTWRKSNNMNI